MMDRISASTSQKRLWQLWGAAIMLFFLVIAAQWLLGRYGVNRNAPWLWLGSVLLSPMALLVGQLGYTMRHESSADSVNRGLHRIAMWLSLVHVVLVALVIFGQPFSGRSPTELMNDATGILWFTQAAVGAFLSALFVSQRPEGPAIAAV